MTAFAASMAAPPPRLITASQPAADPRAKRFRFCTPELTTEISGSPSISEKTAYSAPAAARRSVTYETFPLSAIKRSVTTYTRCIFSASFGSASPK